MALTTRATVLQRLGLTDDASALGAITVAINTDSALVNWTITKSGNTLTYNLDPASGSFNLAASGYDTMTELAAALEALTNVSSAVVSSGLASNATSLLDDGTYTFTAAGGGVKTNVLTYTNAASGTNSALIDSLIPVAGAAIGRFCNRIDETGAQTFESASRTEDYDGSGDPILCLRNYPVTSVTSISLLDETGTVISTLSTSDYRIDLRSGRIHWTAATAAAAWSGGYDSPIGPSYGSEPVGWPVGFQNIRVVYTGGYSTVPYDLQNVATEVVRDLFLDRRRAGSASAQSAQGVSVNYLSPYDAVARWTSMLAPYMNRSGA